MSSSTLGRIRDSLNIVWTIALKDIVDAIKNKVVISMIIMLSFVLLMPKMLPLIFEQPQLVLPVYDQGSSQWVVKLKDDPDIAVQTLRSEQELQAVLCSSIYPLVALRLPADFDQLAAADGLVEIQGSTCWGKRHQVMGMVPTLEEILTRSLGKPVTVQLEGNIVYPPSQSVLMLSIANINAVLMILTMGIFLVPTLFLEEKEARTLQALLVSPCSIGQVVAGKALAGMFYILVTAVMIFIITWAEVIHWEVAVLFVIGGGVFSVAVGLILGSFYEKQQDIVGWMSALLILLVGAIFVRMLGMELPAWAAQVLSWVPSVALAEICRAAFSEPISRTQVLTNLLISLSVSLPLYGLVIWKIRRSDRQ